jgi:hypothetical protein
VPEQCLVFGFHISSLVQGVDILVQDILVSDILFQDWLRLPYRAGATPAASDAACIARRTVARRGTLDPTNADLVD